MDKFREFTSNPDGAVGVASGAAIPGSVPISISSTGVVEVVGTTVVPGLTCISLTLVPEFIWNPLGAGAASTVPGSIYISSMCTSTVTPPPGKKKTYL